MTATLPASYRSTKPNISAQDLIRLPSATCKNGLLRKKGTRLTLGKWPRRFVVLSYDSVYIYSNETSKSPKSKFSLHGYNRVSRTEVKGHDWCFAILPAANVPSLKEKTFACVSDAERKAWMKAIRDQIYTANKVFKPGPSVLEKLRSLSISESNSEDDYIIVEESVYEAGDLQPPEFSTESDDADSLDDSFDSSSDESFVAVKKKCRSQSLPHNSFIKHDMYTDGSSVPKPSNSWRYEDVTIEPGRASVSTKTTKLKRVPSDPVSQPPRYSAVCQESPEHDYANLPRREDHTYEMPATTTASESLETMCTVDDVNPDRDHLIHVLQAKKLPGTYLVRKSRTGDDKVIVYLTAKGDVKEYKILLKDDQFSLDLKKYFKSIEELLRHYTNVEPIPNSDHFLKQGLHSVQ